MANVGGHNTPKAKLDYANTAYYAAVDIAALTEAAALVDDALGYKALYQELRDSGEALRMRLECKVLMTEYAEDLESDIAARVREVVERDLPVAQSKGYKKTADALTKSLALVDAVRAWLDTMARYLAQVRSGNALSTSNAIIIENVKATVDAADASVLLDSPFGEGVAFCDIRKSVVDRLSMRRNEVIDACLDALAACVPCKQIDLSHCPYVPEPEVVGFDVEVSAKTTVLNTPFKDEARLAAWYYVQKDPLYELDASMLSKEADVDCSFTFLSHKGAIVLITGLCGQTDEIVRHVMKYALERGKGGSRVFLMDELSDRLYNAGVAIACELPGYNVLDISQTYLTMPNSADVLHELRDKEYIKESDPSPLEKMPFLGFMGLNEILSSAHKNDWRSRGKQISTANESAARKYLLRLKTSALLLDRGWGDFEKDVTHVTEINDEFDYDNISDIHLANVRRIVESGASMFGVCGMIARYCTTGTDDFSVWDSIPREEMEERITLATCLVMKALRVPIVPQVAVLDELGNKTAGGLCIDGGKRIEYKYSDCKSLQWLRGAIVHECFHALQHRLLDGYWAPWHYESFGITRGRVEQWRETLNRKYDNNTNSVVYRVHMFEADARAFEADCRYGMENAWNTVELV